MLPLAAQHGLCALDLVDFEHLRLVLVVGSEFLCALGRLAVRRLLHLVHFSCQPTDACCAVFGCYLTCKVAECTDFAWGQVLTCKVADYSEFAWGQVR